MKKIKESKAITLVALVITIIILLILAGISIAQLTENGLFENSKLAKEKYKNATELENDILVGYENEINNSRGTITVSQEEWDKVEKVDNIPMNGNLAYGNTTLDYDFSKYKRLRCYAYPGLSGMIFEIDLRTLTSSTEYVGSGVASRHDASSNALEFMCTMSVNEQKNQLKLLKIGFVNGATYNDRLTNGNQSGYFVYRVEGIY